MVKDTALKARRSGGFVRALGRDIRRNWELYLFSLPGLALIIIFNYLPMYDGILMSFKNYVPKLGVNGSEWVGLKNYERFFSSYNFWKYLWNTLRLSLYSLAISWPAPIILALMVHELNGKWFKRIFQTVSYAPYFISTVVIVGMMNLMFDEKGLVNNLIGILGAQPVNFALKISNFPHMYVWSGIWQGVGYGAVVYIAALSAVDPQQLEAAKIDGATKLQRIWYIELPCILPTAVIMLIFAFGSLLGSAFEKILLMQTPLNLEYSEVISTYVYKVGLLDSKFSFSAAVGMFNSVSNFVLLTLVNFIARRISSTSLW